MSAQNLFPTELTEGERAAGFESQTIKNPDGHYVGQPPTIDAIVCPVSSSRRVVKVRLPDDRIGYQLQRYGRYSFHEPDQKPRWLIDLDFSVLDPAFAVQYFQTPLAEQRGQGAKIVEVTGCQY